VDAKTENSAIEAAFDRFTSERKDIAILLINQHVRCWTGWAKLNTGEGGC